MRLLERIFSMLCQLNIQVTRVINTCYINIIRLLSISRLKTENSLLQSDLPVTGNRLVIFHRLNAVPGPEVLQRDKNISFLSLLRFPAVEPVKSRCFIVHRIYRLKITSLLVSDQETTVGQYKIGFSPHNSFHSRP